MKRAAIIVVVTIVIGVASLFCRFNSRSVCSVCGCTCQNTDLQLPLVPITYWRFQSTSETPLSEQVKQLNLAPGHRHDWIFMNGGGNGVMCALGNGGEMYANTQMPEVTAFVADTYRYRDAEEARHWLRTALREREASALRLWLVMGASPPYAGFDSTEDYERWRNEADREWPEILEMKR